MIKNWKHLRQEQGPDLSLFKVRFDYLKNPRNDKTVRVVVLESNDSVTVIALTARQEIVMVRQLRFGTGRESLELPGGLVDDGEGHEQAAKRELLEETGYGQGKWRYLGRIDSNPVYMNSEVHQWLVSDVQFVQKQQLDEAEHVEVVCVPIDQLKNLAQSGRISHPHTISTLSRVFSLYESEIR